jgi:hypothetical protein
MKNIALIFFLSSCTVTQPSTKKYLLVEDYPTTVSKEVLLRVAGASIYSSVSSEKFLVIRETLYLNYMWREAVVVYYQLKVGVLWEMIDYFPLQGEYPVVERVVQPTKERVVIWMTLCKDVTVTRSYVFHGNAWTPQ